MANPLLEKLKIQLGINDSAQDKRLEVLLEDSAEAVSQMTNRTNLSSYQGAVRAFAVIMYNKIGHEGLSSYSAGGVSVSYEELPIAVRGLLPSPLVSVAGKRFENVETKSKT